MKLHWVINPKLSLHSLKIKYLNIILIIEEAVRLKSTSSEIEVWLFKDDLIARTSSTIIYPSFKSSVTSTGGVSVYTFDPENQSITISDKNGLPKTIHIENE